MIMDKDTNLRHIIEEEILKFEGVSRLPKSGKASRSGEYSHPSIRINEEDGEYILGIDVLVCYGTNIPQLCYDIQTGLIHSLMEQAGAIVKTVNIRVEGIDRNQTRGQS